MDKAREWEILFHREFDTWLTQQENGQRRESWANIDLLSRLGPQLGRPRVDTVKNSAFPNMKELRVQYAGKPWRILFAFDPSRNAILLVGGTKVGKADWYKTHIPIADQKFREHLNTLKTRKEE